MAGDPQHDRHRLASWYERFAAEEAHGESAIYERLAYGVATSPALLDFLLTLPRQRRQPNLFLAAARRLHGVPEDLGRLVDIVAADGRRARRRPTSPAAARCCCRCWRGCRSRWR
jgi:hypothetical protein